jgi:hypothetical protein
MPWPLGQLGQRREQYVVTLVWCYCRDAQQLAAVDGAQGELRRLDAGLSYVNPPRWQPVQLNESLPRP